MSNLESVSTRPSLEEWFENYREQVQRAERDTIVLYLRSRAPKPGNHEYRERIIDGLASATETDRIGSYEISVLGAEICCCRYCRGIDSNEAVTGELTALKEWRSGGIRADGFRERTIDSSITGENHRRLVPPEILLGVYVEDSLEGVFPCVADGASHTPLSFVELLTTGEASETEHEDQLVQ